MDCSFSAPFDESDEPQIPLRSPSRLDFCMEDPEDGGSVLETGDDSVIHCTEWHSTSFCDNCPYTSTEPVVDIAPLGHSRLLSVVGGEDEPPQATDSHPHENADTPHIPREHPTKHVVIEPHSPTPARPLVVQSQLDAETHTPPSPTATQRLNYPHHGLSRSALHQQKTLWGSRHEEWVEWQSRMEQGEAQKQGSETNAAYTGLATTQVRVGESPPPYMRIPPSGLERDLADNPPRKHELDVHASIFPRVGDISALRDPYSVNIDRCFFKYPLWTLHKTLYVFNMHQRSTLSMPVYNTAHTQASMSSSTLSSYTSSASGDDEESDSTLVADDSPISKSQLPLDPLQCPSSPHRPPSWNRFRAWELSWYARWELLIGLFQRDYAKHDTPDIPMKSAPQSKEAPSSPPARIFRFTIGDDEDNNDEDGYDDYGTIVSDSNFSADFDEECERALAFYSRESDCSEVTW